VQARTKIPRPARDDKHFLKRLLTKRKKDIMNRKTSWRMISVSMLALFALLLTAAVSFAVYHALEAPMISLGRRLATRNEMRETSAPNPVLSTPVLS